MKSKLKSNPRKLKVPIIINNENTEEDANPIRTTLENMSEVNNAKNKTKDNNNLKSIENKIYNSEGSFSFSK